MKLQVLVSTMRQKDYSLIDKMNIKTDAVIINQFDKSNRVILNDHEKVIKWINMNDIGLSKSRNHAIREADSDICIIADDDLVYDENYKEIIVEQFNRHPKADIITFQVRGIEKKFKNYQKKSKELNFITSMRVSSVEIAFRLESIKKANIEFNELFGSGSKYSMSEENIFLTDCLRKGLNILYVPVKIADLHLGDSSWFKGYNNEYFFNKGAAFTAMSYKLSGLYILQFVIRKHRLYKNNISLFEAYKQMKEGKRDYLEMIKVK